MSSINSFPSYYFPNWKILSPAVSEQSVTDAQAKLSVPPTPPPGNNNILANALNYNQAKVPPIVVTSAVGALRVLDDMDYLASLSNLTQLTVTQNLNRQALNTGVKTSALGNIRNSLATLSSTVALLLENNALSTKTATSSDANVVSAVAGSDSPVASSTIVVKQVSADNVLVSNEQPSTHPRLGLTGSFTINGYSVSVESADTLHTLKDKINYGEDLNHNGTLDGPEDINGTGSPGIIFVHPGEYTPGVYIVKDQNGKGYLNPAEDANGNGRLDGGIRDTKVVAGIENNRLTLTSQTGGANTIDLQDPDNILLALGFFERNFKGVSVQKEVQYTRVNTLLPPATDLLVSPRKSVITVDSQTYSSDTNVFKGVAGDTTLTAHKVSDSPVTVRIALEPTQAFDKIKTLFNAFNSAIRTINNELMAPKTFQADPDIQRLRNQLTQSQASVPAVTRRNEDLAPYLAQNENQQMIGFDIVADRRVLNGIAVDNQVQAIKDKMAIPFKSLSADLQKRLSSIGILSAADSTFSLDEVGLKRALTINGDEVLSLFSDPQNGILSLLKNQLDSVLQKDIGRIDLKAAQLEGISNVPAVLAEKYKGYVETFTLREKTQNLIAVA